MRVCGVAAMVVYYAHASQSPHIEKESNNNADEVAEIETSQFRTFLYTITGSIAKSENYCTSNRILKFPS